MRRCAVATRRPALLIRSSSVASTSPPVAQIVDLGRQVLHLLRRAPPLLRWRRPAPSLRAVRRSPPRAGAMSLGSWSFAAMNSIFCARLFTASSTPTRLSAGASARTASRTSAILFSRLASAASSPHGLPALQQAVGQGRGFRLPMTPSGVTRHGFGQGAPDVERDRRADRRSHLPRPRRNVSIWLLMWRNCCSRPCESAAPSGPVPIEAGRRGRVRIERALTRGDFSDRTFESRRRRVGRAEGSGCAVDGGYAALDLRPSLGDQLVEPPFEPLDRVGDTLGIFLVLALRSGPVGLGRGTEFAPYSGSGG